MVFLVEHECQNERAQALVRFGSIPCDFDIFQFEKYKITVGSIKCKCNSGCEWPENQLKFTIFFIFFIIYSKNFIS